MEAPAPNDREAIVVLLGATAGDKQRRLLSGYFTACRLDPLIPSLPQWRGLRACEDALAQYWARQVAHGNYRRVHVLAYISGGLIFRRSASRCDLRNMGSIVYVRSPLQEQVARRLRNIWGRFALLLLPRGRMLVDLAGADFNQPPHPGPDCPQGLLVETRPSRLASRLGITADALPPRSWDPQAMLPGASDCRSLPISHDEAYSSALLLSQVMHFVRNGCFKPDDHGLSANEAALA